MRPAPTTTARRPVPAVESEVTVPSLAAFHRHYEHKPRGPGRLHCRRWPHDIHRHHRGRASAAGATDGLLAPIAAAFAIAARPGGCSGWDWELGRRDRCGRASCRIALAYIRSPAAIPFCRHRCCAHRRRLVHCRGRRGGVEPAGRHRSRRGTATSLRVAPWRSWRRPFPPRWSWACCSRRSWASSPSRRWARAGRWASYRTGPWR